MPHYNVLFLCKGNSARSIMAEAIMNRKGKPTFTAYGGSHPSGSVRPEALSQIENAGLSTENFRSKSWDEFSKPDSLSLDFVFTVCDNAANEACPLWSGQPMTAHWGIPTPPPFKERQKRSSMLLVRLSLCSTDASACFSVFRSRRSIRSPCRRKSTTLGNGRPSAMRFHTLNTIATWRHDV
jgi:protein-tyrosine-phosphatase